MSKTLGTIIKHYRIQANMTQDDLADGICSREHLGFIERGTREPTIDIISKLSKKLNVDLYGAYSNVYSKGSLETYLKCQEINDALTAHDSQKVHALSEDLTEEDMPFGEAHQLFCYIKSLVAIDKSPKSEFVSWIKKGLAGSCLTKEGEVFVPESLNRTEYALILSYAVFLCRNNNPEEGAALLASIHSKAKDCLLRNNLASENDKKLWNNLCCNTIYNLFCFCPTYPNLSDMVDETIEYQKDSGRVFMFPELLLCKSGFLFISDNKDEAVSTYNLATSLGNLFYTSERFSKKSSSLIKSHPYFIDFPI